MKLNMKLLLLMGGGSGTAPFTPASIANLAGWWDASDASTRWQNSNLTTAASANNDPVGALADKSGLTHHQIQATAIKRPLVISAGQNGLDLLRFDGSNDALGAAFTFNFPTTVIIAAKMRTIFGVNTNDIVFDGVSALMALLQNNTPQTLANNGAGVAVSQSAFVSATVVTVVFNNTNWKIRINGVDVTAGGANTGTNNSGGIKIAELFSGGRNSQLDFYEMTAIAAVASDAEIVATENYMRTKWGTA